MRTGVFVAISVSVNAAAQEQPAPLRIAERDIPVAATASEPLRALLSEPRDPAAQTSGTRDLFLSNSVRTNERLRAAGAETRLQGVEGMIHGGYLSLAMHTTADDPPETRAVFAELASFFDEHQGDRRRNYRGKSK